jgi:hypothetical protein
MDHSQHFRIRRPDAILLTTFGILPHFWLYESSQCWPFAILPLRQTKFHIRNLIHADTNYPRCSALSMIHYGVCHIPVTIATTFSALPYDNGLMQLACCDSGGVRSATFGHNTIPRLCYNMYLISNATRLWRGTVL